MAHVYKESREVLIFVHGHAEEIHAIYSTDMRKKITTTYAQGTRVFAPLEQGTVVNLGLFSSFARGE